jgi:hypothetical protein
MILICTIVAQHIHTLWTPVHTHLTYKEKYT